jgi:hypothetical protein
MASGLKQVLTKMKQSLPCLASDFFFKLANKYRILRRIGLYFFPLNTLASIDLFPFIADFHYLALFGEFVKHVNSLINNLGEWQ